MKPSMAWLEWDVSVEAIERRPRVRKPKGCEYIQEVGHVPTEEFFEIWRGAGGGAYYIRKMDELRPWKRGQYVELTPLELMAFYCDMSTTALRRDVLRHLQGALPAKQRPAQTVSVVIAFTGGGQEYIVGVFASAKKAQQASQKTSKKGHTAMVETWAVV